jgi:hypothetical protein
MDLDDDLEGIAKITIAGGFDLDRERSIHDLDQELFLTVKREREEERRGRRLHLNFLNGEDHAAGASASEILIHTLNLLLMSGGIGRGERGFMQREEPTGDELPLVTIAIWINCFEERRQVEGTE